MIKNMSKETSIYCDGAIANGIDEAGNTADTYITAVDQNGIKVHAANNVNTNYASIDATGMEVVRGGTSMAKFGASGARIGRLGAAHSVIDADGQRFYGSNGTTQLANIGYGDSNAQSGTSDQPYFTFGERETTTTQYSDRNTYRLGQHVIYNGDEYVCIHAITTAEAWNQSHWALAIGGYSTAGGRYSTASGFASHAQNYYATAMGSYSSAGGFYTKATGTASHAEGSDSIASGYGAHAEGAATEASGNDSHAQNSHTIAASDSQTAIGKYNDNDPDNAFEVGNGTADDARSNAFAVGWDGTVETAKPIPKASGGTGQTGISQSTVTLSGCTAGGQRVWHNGVTCSVTMIDVKLNAALANGSSVAFGTIPSGYRPSQILYDVASSSNATFCGRLVFRIDQNGQLSLVNRSGSNLPANTPFSLFVTYAI